jgi:predicted alpha-1,6-mannanase (GH76 family)
MPSWPYLSVLALLAVQASSSPIESRSAAVDYGVPSTWRSTGTSRSADERKSISKAAVQKMIDLKGNNGNDNIANMNYWPSANVWTSVVNHDVIGGTGDFRSVSQSAIRDVFNNHKNFRANDFNDDTLWWGFAALFQKQAYNDDNALDQARGNWGDVSQQQVSGTSGFGKSFSWPGSCNGKSTDGGVFWKSSADDRSLNAITTGLLMAESAYLYDITGEQQYLDSANKARTYFQNHLINGNGLVQDGINIETCEVTDWVFTYNQGKYIEALAVLYGKTGDTGYLDEAVVRSIN